MGLWVNLRGAEIRINVDVVCDLRWFGKFSNTTRSVFHVIICEILHILPSDIKQYGRE